MARKPSATVNITLRISEALRRKLEREAKRHNHSLNRELERRLEASFTIESAAEMLVEAKRIFGEAHELYRDLAKEKAK